MEEWPDLGGPIDRWRALRAAIHAEVSDKGYNKEKQAFTQYYGCDHLDASILAQYAKRAHSGGLVAFALGLITETMLGAFEKGEVLPVLLLSLLFGFSLNSYPRAGRPVLTLIDGIAQILFRVLAMIMRLAPLGAFGAESRCADIPGMRRCPPWSAGEPRAARLGSAGEVRRTWCGPGGSRRRTGHR